MVIFPPYSYLFRKAPGPDRKSRRLDGLLASKISLSHPGVSFLNQIPQSTFRSKYAPSAAKSRFPCNGYWSPVSPVGSKPIDSMVRTVDFFMRLLPEAFKNHRCPWRPNNSRLPFSQDPEADQGRNSILSEIHPFRSLSRSDNGRSFSTRLNGCENVPGTVSHGKNRYILRKIGVNIFSDLPASYLHKDPSALGEISPSCPSAWTPDPYVRAKTSTFSPDIRVRICSNFPWSSDPVFSLSLPTVVPFVPS